MNGHFVGTPYKRFRPTGSFDAIVIGSGIGGLGAAALLARAAGLRVLVLERHYTAGGLTHVFHRPGFEWDVGVHYVGQVCGRDAALGTLFDYLAGGRLAWIPMPDVYDRVDIGGRRFDYVTGQRRLRDALAAAFPRETRAIDRYFNAIRACVRAMPLFYAAKVLPPAIADSVGGALRTPFLRFARRTTAAVLRSCQASPELTAVLTAQWGDYGLPPGRSSFGMHAIVAAHYFEGAAYPTGGASAIARSLLPTIEGSGGEVVVAAEVERIIVRDGRVVGVRMTDGTEFRASRVISDVGIRATLGRLLPDPPVAVRQILTRLDVIEPSMAHLCLHVGLSSAQLSGPLSGTNLWIHPDIDFDRNWSRFASNADAPFPLLFIAFPSAKDPTFEQRYPGHQTIEVIAPVPYEMFVKWRGSAWKRRGDAYASFKKRFEERMLAALYEHVPATVGAVTMAELSTPLSTEHFINAAHGEAYGLAHSPARFVSRDLRPRTPIGGLFLTGQDVSTCGVGGALAGAVAAASAVLRRNLFGEMTKTERAAA